MKKIMSLILSVCMLFCSIAVSHAEDDKGLEAAITGVKSVIDVPEEFSEFNYRSYSAKNKSVWMLSWLGEGGYLETNITADGEILNYYFHDSNADNSRWANITTSEAQEMAEEFIKKVNPALFERLVLCSKQSYSYGDTEFEYAESINGIKIYNRNTYVTVDRVNKRVVNYYTEGKTDKEAVSADTAISVDKALDAYTEKMGAEIVYKKKYDYKEKTVSTYPVYQLKDKSRKAVDALSGEAVEYARIEGDNYFGTVGGSGSNKNEAMEDAEADMGAQLTPEEILAIESVSGLMGIDAADAIVKKEFGVLDGAALSASSLSKDYYSDKYTYNLRYYRGEKEDGGYINASASLDAKTGELLNWSCYRGAYSASVSAEEAKKTAGEFLLRNAAEKIKLCGELLESSSGLEKEKFYTFSANRLANGAVVEDENISVTVDPDGQISRFSADISDYLTFESIDAAMDERSAIAKIAELSGFELCYVYSADADKYIPVYEFSNKYTTINPMTGEKTQLGSPEPVKPEKYTDISEHWAESTVNTLLDNGYFMEGESFEPDKPITVKEFLSYAKFIGANADDDEIALMVSYMEPESEEPDINLPLTRKIAARYITENMGYGDIAKHSEIYKYPFADAVSEEYTGYISICYAKKIFKGDMQGNFNPDKSMTRAEAAAVIYNYYSTR